jgi:hypothetical protein
MEPSPLFLSPASQEALQILSDQQRDCWSTAESASEQQRDSRLEVLMSGYQQLTAWALRSVHACTVQLQVGHLLVVLFGCH